MRCPGKSFVVAILLLAAVVLLRANAALAGLEVSFVVPSSVVAGISFPITVNVKNTDVIDEEHPAPTPITFNRVAAGYALADWKIKGPYEVDATPRTLAAQESTSFTFNFRIFYGTGTIVPVAVFLAQNSYQSGNMKGGGIVGIKVGPPPQ